MRDMSTRFRRFITLSRIDIRSIALRDLSPGERFLIQPVKIVSLAVRRFFKDECPLRASALTYYSLISIVPLAAMAFGIAKGFGLEEALDRILRQKIVGHEEILNTVISFSHTMLDLTRGGVLAGVGVVILLWTVVSILTHIEESLNDIWEAKTRSFGRKFSDYLSLMFICPVVILLAGSLTVFLSAHVPLLERQAALFSIISPFLNALVRLLPYILIWALFTFVYIFMPNTKVTLGAGLVAGIVAGTIYQLLQWGYIVFQIASVRYNAVYGSFAALPLFLLWLQLSWYIVLFGAELSYAYQNIDTYEYEGYADEVSPHFRKLLSLRVMHLLVKNFARGDEPLAVQQISRSLNIPTRLVNELMAGLGRSRLVAEIRTGKRGHHAYQPARDIGTLTIGSVVDSLETAGNDTMPADDTPSSRILSESLASFRNLMETSPSNSLLKDI